MSVKTNFMRGSVLIRGPTMSPYPIKHVARLPQNVELREPETFLRAFLFLMVHLILTDLIEYFKQNYNWKNNSGIVLEEKGRCKIIRWKK